jgi:hypothetical protein
MKISNQTAIVNKVVSEEVKYLVLTFTPEEINDLKTLGRTSHYERVKLLQAKYNSNDTQADKCSSLISEIYFAAAKFKKENSL